MLILCPCTSSSCCYRMAAVDYAAQQQRREALDVKIQEVEALVKEASGDERLELLKRLTALDEQLAELCKQTTLLMQSQQQQQSGATQGAVACWRPSAAPRGVMCWGQGASGMRMGH